MSFCLTDLVLFLLLVPLPKNLPEERGYTGQRGQDEQNRRARKAAVQTPGKALGRAELTIGSNTGGFVSQ